LIIDIEKIKRRLFDDPAIRAKLVHDYKLPCEPADPDALASDLLRQLEQTPVEDPLAEKWTNKEVFKASVRALGSNSRAWAKFLEHEKQLRELLGDYDPEYTRKAKGALCADLQSCLPGQTSATDACAIICWARLLAETDDYYAFVCDLGQAFRRLAGDSPFADTDLLPCVAGYLGKPPRAWKGEKYLCSPDRVPQERRKSPGMGYVLASEFLRNLGWKGFKPDRHVKRLFARWSPNGAVKVNSQAQNLARLIGSADKELRTNLAYSALGVCLSPSCMPLSHVDNLVWLLGVYVEKKNKESDHVYLKSEGVF
jgi:hypothetical protein